MTAPRANLKASLIQLKEHQATRWLEQGREIVPDESHGEKMAAGILSVLILVGMCVVIYGRTEGWW